MATEEKENENKQAMSTEDKAFLIKALWKALQEPTWTKNDLIAFGMAIFSKHTLGKMPEKTFEVIYPFLTTIAESLGEQLSSEAAKLINADEQKEKNDVAIILAAGEVKTDDEDDSLMETAEAAK